VEWGGFEYVLYSSRVTPDTMNKVPKEFTINHPKVGCPDGVFFRLGHKFRQEIG
jgi:hypothetical protein